MEESPKFELKKLNLDGIKAAFEKAVRYRLLNQPRLAASICYDILEVDPNHENAIIELILALSDQFERGSAQTIADVNSLLTRLIGDYNKTYYNGIVRERRGTSALTSRGIGTDYVAFGFYMSAMEFYEEAEKLSPPDNNDAILRWNTCARIIMEFRLRPDPADNSEPVLE